MTRSKTTASLKTTVWLCALLFAGLSAVAARAAAPAVHLKERIVVRDSIVTLGDMFDGAGAAASLTVTTAPAPGQRKTVATADIQRLLQRNGLTWDFPPRTRGIAIERAGRRVTAADLAALIAETLRRQGQPERKVSLSNPNLTLFLPVGSDARVSVKELDFAADRGRFTALLAVPDDRGTTTLRVTGRAVRTLRLPILRTAKNRGEVIRKGDIGWIEVASGRIAGNIATDIDQLVGLAARRRLQADSPVRLSDVAPPVVVAKGSLVTMVVATPMLTLTATGRALENGAAGETIQVRNTNSKATIEAIVVSPSEVRVPVGARLVTAAR